MPFASDHRAAHCAARNPLLVVAGLLILAGCAQAGSGVTNITSAGVAAAVGSAVNPVVGLVVGVGVAYGVDQGVKYGARRIEGNVQNAIARTAGRLGEGQSAKWEVAEKLPLTERWGKVQVIRAIEAEIPCKEVIFTVEDEPDFYSTTICRNPAGDWRWALAEPTVERWRGFQ